MDKERKKYLIVFDFDQTITDKDSEFSAIEYFIPEFYKENEHDLYNKKDWLSFNNLIYTKLKENGFNWEIIKKWYEDLKLSPKMEELFKFILEHQNNIDSVICTGNNIIVVDTFLKKNKLDNIIKYKICNNSELDNDNILKITYLNEKYENCKDCKPFLCKSLAIDNFFEKHKRESYNKVIFIGDGKNDFCFSKHLNEKDILFPRNGFSLYRILFNENKKNMIKAEIHPWENGTQIVNILQKLEF